MEFQFLNRAAGLIIVLALAVAFVATLIRTLS